MTSRLPPLDALRYFEACARHAQMTRAADELGVTPAAVSLRVRQLERDLGTPLFQRSGPRITLTDAGQALAGRLGVALTIIRDAVAVCRTAPEPIRLTATPTLASRWLLPLLDAYGREEGAMPVTLDVSVEMRGPGDFDLALRSGTGAWPGLTAVMLFPVEGTPMLAPGLAARLNLREPADMARCPVVPDSRWGDWLCLAGMPDIAPISLPTTFPTQDMAAGAALAGAGAALLSPTLFAPLLEQGLLVQPFGPVLRGPDAYFLAWRSETASPAIRHLAGFILAMARKVGEGISSQR